MQQLVTAHLLAYLSRILGILNLVAVGGTHNVTSRKVADSSPDEVDFFKFT
jgi:hypothetical protein